MSGQMTDTDTSPEAVKRLEIVDDLNRVGAEEGDVLMIAAAKEITTLAAELEKVRAEAARHEHEVRKEALEEAAQAIVEPISAYIYDTLYKKKSPIISHTHQNTYEAAQAAIRAMIKEGKE